MPRQARLDAPGTLHHVMIRGIEATIIFRDDSDREQFLSRIGLLVVETGLRVLAWTLMDNHVHLLLISGGKGLSKFMRCLLTGYAVWFNHRHQRHGHLFQNRFKSIVCEEDPYLLELVRYIHLNPVRAGLVQNMEQLERYPWSGHSVLMGRTRREWQETDYVLERFGQTAREAIGAYRRFVAEGMGQGRRTELVGGGFIQSRGGWSQVLSLRDRKEREESDERILGSGDFVTGILREAEQRISRQLRLRGRNKEAEAVIQRVCKEKGVTEEEIASGAQRRHVTEARAKLSYHLSHDLGMPMADIARRLGVCTSAVFKAIRKYESERQE